MTALDGRAPRETGLTNRDLYLAIAELTGDPKRAPERDLEEYLRALLRGARTHRAADGLTTDQFVSLLTASFWAEPLPYECRPQGSVRGIGPAVTEEDSSNGVLLARLQQHLLVMRVGARFRAGQKPRAEHGGLRAKCQHGDQASAVRDAARSSDRPRRDGIHDPWNQG